MKNISKDVDGLFTNVKTVRSFEDISKQIQQAIADGDLKPGDRLPNERDLAGLFSVSRSTLREAVRTLEGAGLVEVTRGKGGGIFVSDMKSVYISKAFDSLIRFRIANKADLLEFRKSFESQTAYIAAKRCTKEQLQRLEEKVQLYKEEANKENPNWEKLVDIDIDFHTLLAEASNNTIREAIMLGIYEVLRESALLLETIIEDDFMEIAIEQQTAITEAIKNREPETAQMIMLDHIDHSSELNIIKSKS